MESLSRGAIRSKAGLLGKGVQIELQKGKKEFGAFILKVVKVARECYLALFTSNGSQVEVKTPIGSKCQLLFIANHVFSWYNGVKKEIGTLISFVLVYCNKAFLWDEES